MQKIICDNCKKEILNKKNYIIIIETHTPIPQENTRTLIEFCETCYKEKKKTLVAL